jgi:uncharacterized protein (UPF0297 family)
MLQDDKTINDNILTTVVNMILSRFDRLEGKTTNYVNLFAGELASKQPQYVMRYNF